MLDCKTKLELQELRFQGDQMLALLDTGKEWAVVVVGVVGVLRQDCC